MDDHIVWLVTVAAVEMSQLVRCALKVRIADLPSGCAAYPMEPECRVAIHALLPDHIKKCGSIVEVTEIGDVCIVKDKD